MARTVIVGLIADPGLPERIADRLQENLADDLANEIDGSTDWQIEVSSETLPLTSRGEIPLAEQGPRLLEQHGWDAVAYLTDLPRRYHGQPIVAELVSAAGIILVSLPALGAHRVAARTRALLVPLLTSLAGATDAAAAADHARRGTSIQHTTADGAHYLIRSGRIHRLRLLAGMVRNNQPGTLLPALSSTAAAGIGTGAFGIFYASIWSMADALPPARLALISLGVTLALSLWLIFYNGLWTAAREMDGRGSPWLDNAATVITVGLSVALMYVLLYLVLLGAALTVITGDYLAGQLDHPVSIADYLRLAWLAASLGTMGGAIGSNFDSEHAINRATYSRREYERRQLAKRTD